MIHWLIIFLGIILLTISISNPFFNLTLKKILNLNIFLIICIRVVIFFISLMIILFGLYIHSIA